MDMINITPIVNAVIAIIAAVATAFLVPWIRSKTTEQQRKEIGAWVKIAVAAAEQLYLGAGRGSEKKEYVLQFLANNGIAVDVDTIEAMIEAAVQQLNSEIGLIIE
ncbi:MAG: phage holin, LLH family [Candidatus Nanoarchaeia archaeon]|nr:phage holin, LLH family [Candidatus Nanoarchaeia archaeon]